MRQRWWMVLVVVVLLAAMAIPASAGILTSSQYTYLLGGQEIDVPVDIYSMGGSFLVPEEFLSRFDVTVRLTGERVRLTRGSAVIELHLGSRTATVDGKRRVTAIPTIRTGGRVMVPAELLSDLAVSMEVDGKLVMLTDATRTVVPGNTGDYSLLFGNRTFTSYIRDGSNMVEVQITVLAEDLLGHSSLPLSWGVRQRLLNLNEERTLLMVRMRNVSVKAMALDPTKLMLVDDQGRQYDYLKQEIAVDGLVSAPLAPSAIRTSVLVYPKVADGLFTVYHDGTGSLGRLNGQ